MPERVHRASLVLAVGTAVFAAGAVGPQGLPGSLRAAAAAEAVFTVGNYPVEARADNAVAAKDRALSEGQQAAFRSLLRRLVPVTAFQRLKQLPAVRAGDLLEGVKVRAERNSATDYIASLDFSLPVERRTRLAAARGHPLYGRAGAGCDLGSRLARRRRRGQGRCRLDVGLERA